ncbi:hypothetical protein AA696_10480 [Salmonella enterica subsp. enterica]|nr:hypothetical protein [Salmonella enterica subsp. enterica serovar Brazzaville]ECE6339866.1 hypothetical protein [Salmonella enterica subsp. enterica]ECG1258795.1 hypothetical protein [Salmonella enterica subsp. enterica]
MKTRYPYDHLKKFHHVINKKHGFLSILRDTITTLYLLYITNNIKLIYVLSNVSSTHVIGCYELET